LALVSASSTRSSIIFCIFSSFTFLDEREALRVKYEVLDLLLEGIDFEVFGFDVVFGGF
jgi:hypothetical protein